MKNINGIFIACLFLLIVSFLSWFNFYSITGNQISSDSLDCLITDVSFDRVSANVEDTVNIVVIGENCNGHDINIDIFEKDSFFNDKIHTFSGNFIEDKVLVEWLIDKEIYGLFGERFEGQELELYAFVNLWDKKISNTLHVSKSKKILLQPSLNYPVGFGCTTAWYIDKDCDGYGVGKQSGGQYGRYDVNIHGDLPDVDDSDPNLNTPQSVNQNYGDFRDIQNLRNFLVSRGYNNPRNIYFIAPNGVNTNGQANNISRPYAGFGAIRSLVGSNDFVIYRNGTYSSSFSILNLASGSTIPRGTPGNPIVFMSYPGELAVFDAFYGIGGLAGTRNIVVDGFVITCQPGVCNTNGFGQIGIDITGSAINLTIRNVESLRHRWGVWGGTPKDRVTIESSVIHDNAGEHGIYIPNSDQNPHTNFVINGNLIYRNRRHGIQFNGKMENFIVENNIIHSNALGGITLTNGVQYSKFRNNLIFNNNKQGIILFSYCDSAYFTCASLYPGSCLVGQIPECPTSNTSCNRGAFPQCYGDGALYRQSNDYNQFINNLVWIGSSHNGVCEDQWAAPPCSRTNAPFDFSAVEFADVTPRKVYTFTGNIFRNNIFSNYGAPLFKTDNISHLITPGALIENNLFFRSTGEPAGLISTSTDGTHSNAFGVTPRYYTWTFSEFQNHVIWRSFVRNNVLGNPGFSDVSVSYYLNPGNYNFDPISTNSLSINLGLFLGAPLLDIRMNSRVGNIDAGIYELGGSVAPILTGISPNPIMNNQDHTIQLIGTRFDNPGAILEACLSSICSSVPSTIISSQEMRFIAGRDTPPDVYGFQVRNLDGQVSNRLNLTVLLPTVPNTPSDLNVTPVSSIQLRLNWKD
ncbi:MAG: right-handed parallel beta-helix repeat-containing protein, partial [Nanoarchaeota archaeon]